MKPHYRMIKVWAANSEPEPIASGLSVGLDAAQSEFGGSK